MDVTHILLGRLWLFNLNVTHHARDNTYTFRYQNKNITLTPCQPTELLPSPSLNPPPPLYSPPRRHPPPWGTIFLIPHHQACEKSEKSSKFSHTFLAREPSSHSISFPVYSIRVQPFEGNPNEIDYQLKIFAYSYQMNWNYSFWGYP